MNWDGLTTAGAYTYRQANLPGNNAPPVGYSFGIVLVFRSTEGTVAQIVIAHQAGGDGRTVLYRVKFGTWGPWQSIA